MDCGRGVSKGSRRSGERAAARQVYANDLNPASHRWLVHNIALNKVRGCRARLSAATTAEQTKLISQMPSYMKELP
jgi:tRNA G37 N-methylase Trm5